jgi:hypothetical protein
VRKFQELQALCTKKCLEQEESLNLHIQRSSSDVEHMKKFSKNLKQVVADLEVKVPEIARENATDVCKACLTKCEEVLQESRVQQQENAQQAALLKERLNALDIGSAKMWKNLDSWNQHLKELKLVSRTMECLQEYFSLQFSRLEGQVNALRLKIDKRRRPNAVSRDTPSEVEEEEVDGETGSEPVDSSAKWHAEQTTLLERRRHHLDTAINELWKLAEQRPDVTPELRLRSAASRSRSPDALRPFR